jgi:hypothetical protein
MSFRHSASAGDSSIVRLRLAGTTAAPLPFAALAACLCLGGCVGQIGERAPLQTGTGAGAPSPGSGGATSAGGSSSGAGNSPAGTTGSAGTPSGNGGASGTGAGGSSGGPGTAGLPCDVQALVSSKCWSCHGTTPQPGLPSFATYGSLTAPSTKDPSQTNAQRALARMQDNTTPMPPPPGTRATAAEIAAMQAWINAGYSAAGCGTSTGGSTGGGADAGADAGATPDAGDPFGVPPTCTSGKSWTGGNNGSASMNPGMACISCHQSSGGEAPRYAIAGTVYPSAHEPDKCNGANGSTGIQVQIIPKSGQTITITPNGAGNFSYSGTIALPYQAKVIYMGRERIMSTPQQSGDCNGCHTQSGAMGAPGRILLP